MTAEPKDGVSADRPAVPANLGTRVVGREIRWYDSVPSTNDLALRLAEAAGPPTQASAPEGTVVIAEEQTAGRGRLGRAWVSPRGGIWLSVVLRPHLPPERIAVVGLMGAVAAARAIRATTGLPARLKWPNDVLVEGKKVVGVLAEVVSGAAWVVVGIGINANVPPDALPQTSGSTATSLQALLGRAVERGVLIRALLQEVDREYALLESVGAGAILLRWREMTETLGRDVSVETTDGTIHGTAGDIDEAGALLLRCRDGSLRRVVAGDVRLGEAGH